MVTTLEQAGQAVLDFATEMDNLAPEKGGFYLYKKLIDEELSELEEAESLAEIWKEAADLLVVTLGAILSIGVTPKQLPMIFDRVINSNLSKVSLTSNEVQEWIDSNGLYAYVEQTPTGKFIAKDPSKKALKGPNYKKAEFTEEDVKNYWISKEER